LSYLGNLKRWDIVMENRDVFLDEVDDIWDEDVMDAIFECRA
jgi:hypothetical protein